MIIETQTAPQPSCSLLGSQSSLGAHRKGTPNKTDTRYILLYTPPQAPFSPRARSRHCPHSLHTPSPSLAHTGRHPTSSPAPPLTDPAPQRAQPLPHTQPLPRTPRGPFPQSRPAAFQPPRLRPPVKAQLRSRCPTASPPAHLSRCHSGRTDGHRPGEPPRRRPHDSPGAAEAPLAAAAPPARPAEAIARPPPRDAPGRAHRSRHATPAARRFRARRRGAGGGR